MILKALFQSYSQLVYGTCLAANRSPSPERAGCKSKFFDPQYFTVVIDVD